MQKASAEEEQQIISLILEYRDGKKDFTEIRYMLYDYAFILTKPVFKDDNICGQIAEHILKRLEGCIDRVNLESDFYTWFSGFCAYRMCRIIGGKKGFGFEKTKHFLKYQYQNISEDQQLAEAASEYFDRNLRQTDDSRDKLHTYQRLILEMYAVLEMNTDSISRIFKVEQRFIQNEIARIRKVLVKESIPEREEKDTREDIGRRNNTNKDTDEGFLQLLFPKIPRRVWIGFDLVATVMLAIAYILYRV